MTLLSATWFWFADTGADVEHDSVDDVLVSVRLVVVEPLLGTDSSLDPSHPTLACATAQGMYTSTLNPKLTCALLHSVRHFKHLLTELQYTPRTLNIVGLYSVIPR